MTFEELKNYSTVVIDAIENKMIENLENTIKKKRKNKKNYLLIK